MNIKQLVNSLTTDLQQLSKLYYKIDNDLRRYAPEQVYAAAKNTWLEALGSLTGEEFQDKYEHTMSDTISEINSVVLVVDGKVL